MKIGVFSTFMSPIATADMVKDFGRAAEDIGLDSIWLGEHVVLFNEMEFPYPGSADGRIPVPDGGGLLDTVATFGMLAAVTDGLNRLFSNNIRPLRVIRDLGMAAVNVLPPLKKFFMRHAMGVLGDVPRLVRGEAL